MKKLMIAAAIVCAAVVSQASAFKWQCAATGTNGKVYLPDTTTLFTESTKAYIFDNATVSQKDLLTGLFATGDAHKDITSFTAADSVSLSSSKVPAHEFDWGTQGEYYDFYFAVVAQNGDVFLSSMKEDQLNPEKGPTAMNWTDIKTLSQAKATTFNAGTFTSGAGWYTVPEPTSGLLLLLGVAGLALRRRRA